jgi:hypothetical protein
MEAKVVSSAVYQSLAPLLVPKGFRLNRKRGYRRVLPEVRQTVGMWSTDYYLESKFSLTFWFRVEAAEAILRRFDKVDPEDREVRETCGVRLHMLVPSAGEEIVVKNQRALHRALSKLTPVLERDVLPFLDSHQDLKSIDRLMHGATREWFDYWASASHSMNSVIVARLAGNPDWEQLVGEHRDGWMRQKASDQERATYERLVQHLSDMPESGERAEPGAAPDRGGIKRSRSPSPPRRRGR